MSAFSPFTFLHINDHHKGTRRSYRFRAPMDRRWNAIKQQLAEIDADLLLIGGDLTRDGDTHEEEYLLSREDLETLPFPCHVIPGNMDVGNKHTRVESGRRDRSDIALNMTSDRLRLWTWYFGPIHWTFMHRGVRFTGFYEAIAGSGLPEEHFFWRFMERLPMLPRGRHHVAMMHYWLYIDRPDEPNWDVTKPEQYLPWYFGLDEPHRGRLTDLLLASGCEVLFCGHVHTGRPVERIGNMRIYKTPAAGNTAQMTDRWPEVETRQGFQLCRVTREGIEVEFVPCHDQTLDESESYGPGGHPMLGDRDYSLARERPPLAPDPWLV